MIPVSLSQLVEPSSPFTENREAGPGVQPQVSGITESRGHGKAQPSKTLLDY